MVKSRANVCLFSKSAHIFWDSNQHAQPSLPYWLMFLTLLSATLEKKINGITLYRHIYQKGAHCVFLEHWNSQKTLCNIRQRFSCLLDEWVKKICKKIFFHGGFFFKSTLSVLRCTWTGRIIWNYFWDIILTI